tara:strand:- start:76 stop:966 length:891 start_codon:yes stop_codon:yes gene_type:complete
MKKSFTLIIIFSLCFHNVIYSQNNEAAVAAASLAVGALAIAASIENNKEIYEKQASDYLVENYSFEQFRLKMLTYDASKKNSDKGNLFIVPFAFTELEYGLVTDNRKILLAFYQTNQINSNNVNYQNVYYRLIGVELWNSIIISYSMLNSPVKLKIEKYLVPIYNFKENVSFKKKNKLSISSIPKYENSDYAYVKSSEKKLIEYVRNKENKFIDIRKLHIDKLGLYVPDNFGYLGEILYPFFNLKGDDYLVVNFSEDYKLISNEEAMGIFLKDANESVLIPNHIINEIHRFLNFIN